MFLAIAFEDSTHYVVYGDGDAYRIIDVDSCDLSDDEDIVHEGSYADCQRYILDNQ